MTEERRPIWYIYSGMGAQWVGMGRDLMQMSLFRESIVKCAQVLLPLGMDIVALLTSDDPNTFKAVKNAIVCNIAIQVPTYVR